MVVNAKSGGKVEGDDTYGSPELKSPLYLTEHASETTRSNCVYLTINYYHYEYSRLGFSWTYSWRYR